MKHPVSTTALLLLIFAFSQLIGLFIISQYIDITQTSETGITTINEDKYIIQPPEVEDESTSWTFILIPVIIGTGLVLLLMKFKLFGVWKIWFFVSIFLGLFLALHPIISLVYSSFIISAIIAFLLAYYKVKKPNVWIHNSTEILLYGGIAALFVPILNITSGIIMLILISIYDMIAVWYSKHMIAMAKFQTENHAFAGIHIPADYKTMKVKYNSNKKPSKKSTKHSAILGGGDIAFSLLFAGVILKSTGSFYLGGLISLGALLGLTALFLISKKGKFYPAMPFISVGCVITFGIIQLL